MISIEEEGKSIDEAVEAGLRKLGLGREYVNTEILNTGNKGILGIVATKPAKVKLTLTDSGERVFIVKDLIDNILNYMKINVNIVFKDEDDAVVADMEGEESNLLIGKMGRTLESLQYIISRILKKKTQDRVRAHIDIERYVQRKKEKLENMALRLAEKAKNTREAVGIENLSPADRRIVHLALQNYSGIKTTSTGEGPLRKVLIIPTDSKD